MHGGEEKSSMMALSVLPARVKGWSILKEKEG